MIHMHVRVFQIVRNINLICAYPRNLVFMQNNSYNNIFLYFIISNKNKFFFDNPIKIFW